jgi:hypothetical protein
LAWTHSPQAAAEDYSAFGLKFGSSLAQNKYLKNQDYELDSKWTDSFSNDCEKELFYLNWLGPYGEPRDLTALSKKDSYSWSTKFKENRMGADFSERVTGGYYTVPAFGKDLEVCFTYFDDALVMVQVNKFYQEVRDLAYAALTKKYGQPQRYSTITSWKLGGDSFYIVGASGELVYYYVRPRNQMIRWAASKYMAREDQIANESPF